MAAVMCAALLTQRHRRTRMEGLLVSLVALLVTQTCTIDLTVVRTHVGWRAARLRRRAALRRPLKSIARGRALDTPDGARPPTFFTTAFRRELRPAGGPAAELSQFG
ncbi:hypothetical protein [Streptomyces sp. RB17]|uniref:hypothetical protein n=1 Tax=Streptomyces sp. RB17 TaxID=2585197 RepID=UPI001296A031|nr:hypothetical protein [Streptomyces sp. RB17]